MRNPSGESRELKETLKWWLSLLVKSPLWVALFTLDLSDATTIILFTVAIEETDIDVIAEVPSIHSK